VGTPRCLEPFAPLHPPESLRQRQPFDAIEHSRIVGDVAEMTVGRLTAIGAVYGDASACFPTRERMIIADPPA